MCLRRRATFEGDDRRSLPSLRRAIGPGAGEVRKQPRQSGYTLVELIIVVTVLAIIAAIAVPSLAPAEHHKLASAASVVADAVRFAREEARHTGFVHGISTDLSNNSVRVFRLDEVPNPNLKTFDVYQPISKQLYTVQLAAPPFRGVVLNTVGGQMVGTCNDPGNIAFDSSGVVHCVEPVATRIRDASIELALGELRLTVSIDDYTGRVSIQ